MYLESPFLLSAMYITLFFSEIWHRLKLKSSFGRSPVFNAMTVKSRQSILEKSFLFDKQVTSRLASSTVKKRYLWFFTLGIGNDGNFVSLSSYSFAVYRTRLSKLRQW